MSANKYQTEAYRREYRFNMAIVALEVWLPMGSYSILDMGLYIFQWNLSASIANSLKQPRPKQNCYPFYVQILIIQDDIRPDHE